MRIYEGLLKPFVQVILELECNKPKLSRFYCYFQHLISQTSHTVPDETRAKVGSIVERRGNKMFTPELLVAAVLDVSIPAKQRIKLENDQLKQLHPYFVNKFGEEKGQRLYIELSAFHLRSQPFDSDDDWKLAEIMPALDWWKIQHDRTELSKFAQDLLSIVPSSGSAERVWSNFSYIHSKSRNRLANKRVEKLVFIYYNSRLGRKTNQQDTWFDDLEVPETDDLAVTEIDKNESETVRITRKRQRLSIDQSG